MRSDTIGPQNWYFRECYVQVWSDAFFVLNITGDTAYVS